MRGAGPARALLAGRLGATAPAAVAAADELLVRLLGDEAAEWRGHDRRRVTTLTPSGAPIEVSFEVGRSRHPGAVRYVVVPGTARPFFTGRLRALRNAVTVAGGSDTWVAAARSLLESAFPRPGAVAARTRMAGAVGIVHDGRDGAVVGRRLYLDLTVTGSPGGLREGGALSSALHSVTGTGLRPVLAALEDGPECLAARVYAAIPPGWATTAGRTDPVVADLVGPLARSLEDAGLDAAVLDGPALLAVAGDRPVALHLSAPRLRPAPPAATTASPGAEAVARLAAAFPGGAAVLDSWRSSLDATGWWEHTVVGLRLAPGGPAGATFYVAPA